MNFSVREITVVSHVSDRFRSQKLARFEKLRNRFVRPNMSRLPMFFFSFLFFSLLFWRKRAKDIAISSRDSTIQRRSSSSLSLFPLPIITTTYAHEPTAIYTLEQKATSPRCVVSRRN